MNNKLKVLALTVALVPMISLSSQIVPRNSANTVLASNAMPSKAVSFKICQRNLSNGAVTVQIKNKPMLLQLPANAKTVAQLSKGDMLSGPNGSKYKITSIALSGRHGHVAHISAVAQ